MSRLSIAPALRRIALLGAAALVPAACAPSPPSDTTAARQALLAADSSFARRSVEIGSAEAFREYLLPEALQLPAGGMPIEGREAIYASMHAGNDGFTAGALRSANQPDGVQATRHARRNRPALSACRARDRG